MTETTEKPKTEPDDNPWYRLMTQPGKPGRPDNELQARNRVAWNRCMASTFGEELRARLIKAGKHSTEELTPLSTVEMQAVEAIFLERGIGSRVATTTIADLIRSEILFSNTSVGRLSAEGFIFSNSYFENATFSEGADFAGATFSGMANFENATLFGRADFAGATFSGWASFAGATFSEGGFEGATFSEGANFESVTFSIASFAGATFSELAHFTGATFFGVASFAAGETFSKRADFAGATFSGWSCFAGATFSKRANSEGADCRGANCLRDGRLRKRDLLSVGPASKARPSYRRFASLMRK